MMFWLMERFLLVAGFIVLLARCRSSPFLRYLHLESLITIETSVSLNIVPIAPYCFIAVAVQLWHMEHLVEISLRQTLSVGDPVAFP